MDQTTKSSLSQLTNFCIDPCITSVTTSSIAADGYAPGNLTSTDPQTKSKGFRVEHFMRPPIHIDFEFNVPINVAYIIVSPNLEEESKMRVEISGSFQVTTPEHHYKLCQSGVVINSQRSVLVLVNRAYQDGVLHTQTLREAVKDVVGSCMSLSLVEAELMEQPLKHANILVKLRTLRVTVNRMSGPKPVAFKAVEVWGTLSKVSNKRQRDLYQRALSVLLPIQLSVFKDTPLTGPKELLQSKQHSLVVCPNVHKEECCSQGLTEHEREGGLFQSQHTPDLETNEQYWIMNSPIQSITQCSTNVASDLSKKERDIQTHTGMKGRFHLINNIPSKMSQRNQLDTDSRHFAGCSNEVIPQTVKPEVSLLGNEKILTATGSLQPPQPSRGPGVVYSPPCDDGNLQLQSNICPSTEDIPAQFLDEITYEVMQLPMLLPSGHYVDRSTLDRLANNDAMYGRSPLDPFTGIAFTDSSKPEFCPKLKLQLDEFLSYSDYENTRHSNNRGRTLGSADEIASHLKTIGSERGTKRRSGHEEYSYSEVKRSKNTPNNSCLVTLEETLQTGCPKTPISREKHPALIPTNSTCCDTSMLAKAWSFPTSLQGQCLDLVTTSKPPTRKRMCDQTNQNVASGYSCDSEDKCTSHQCQTLRIGGNDEGTNFESEVSGSLDLALEKVLSS